MQWMTPREFSSPWVSKSTDGYYAIGQSVMGQYGAFYSDALWARPVEIGVGGTVEQAQEICENHRKALPKALPV